MATATWVRNELEERGVHYEELHYGDVYTAQELAASQHISGHHLAKVVVVMVDGRPVELILPASRHVHLDRVKELLDSHDVRLATEAELEEYFADCELGAIPALRHWQGVAVLMDESMRVAGEIVFPAGTHRDAVRVNFQDWFDLVQPRVESFCDTR
jgi:Ala-tRNA(Pro) deacylase